MNQGDLVRLKQPFSPDSRSSQVYQFGVVVEIISLDLSPGDATTGKSSQSSEQWDWQKTEVLLYLYAPDAQDIYRDSQGEPALYSFYGNEVLQI